MKGMSNFTIYDEAFYSLTWAHDPEIHVLATAVIPGTPSAGTHKGEVVPQIWTYEHRLPGGQPARAFVWMQGHDVRQFRNYRCSRCCCAASRGRRRSPVDTFVDYVPPQPPHRPRPK